MLCHHRLLSERLLNLIPALTPLGPNEQLRSIAENAREMALDEMVKAFKSTLPRNSE